MMNTSRDSHAMSHTGSEYPESCFARYVGLDLDTSGTLQTNALFYGGHISKHIKISTTTAERNKSKYITITDAECGQPFIIDT